MEMEGAVMQKLHPMQKYKHKLITNAKAWQQQQVQLNTSIHNHSAICGVTQINIHYCLFKV